VNHFDLASFVLGFFIAALACTIANGPGR